MKLTFSTFGSKYAPRPSRSGLNSLWLLLLPAVLTVLLGACRDEDFMGNLPVCENTSSRLNLDEELQGGLRQLANGAWKTENSRVPLVGEGCIVENMPAQLLGLLEGGSKLGNLVDLNLDNTVSFTSVANVKLLSEEIISIKDIHRKYVGGQMVGFIYRQRPGANVVNLDLLKSFVITLYNDGKEVSKSLVAGSDDPLGLSVLNIGGSNGSEKRVLAFTPSEDVVFDEIRLSSTGIQLNVLSNLELFYAFVGENPEIKAKAGVSYWENVPALNMDSKGVHSAGKYTQELKDVDNLVAATEKPAYTTLGGLGGFLKGDVRATVNFGQTLEPGYEVGYKYAYEGGLNLSLLGTEGPSLTLYNKDMVERDNMSPDFSLLNVGIKGEDMAYASMIVDDECKDINQATFELSNDLLSKLGNLLEGLLFGKKINLYYAYIRKPVTLDPANYFTAGTDTTYQNSYLLPKPYENKGQLVFELMSQPYGASAQCVQENDGWKIKELTKVGAYRLRATYVAENGSWLTHDFILYKKEYSQQENCNNYITAVSHGAYATEAKGWSGCLLCLLGGVKNAQNVVDNDFSNYLTYRKVLTAASVEPIVAIQMNKSVKASGKKMRVGFEVQPGNGLLGASLLKLYNIKLYKGEQLVSSNPTADNATVGVGLLQGEKDRVRLSVETEQDFDRMELWTTGLLQVGLEQPLRVYNAFYEDVSCRQTSSSETCMEVMSNLQHGLLVDYDHTDIGNGVLDLAVVAQNMSYLIDGSKETGMLIYTTASLVSHNKIGLKFRELPANQSIGVILGGFGDVVSVDLLQNMTFKAFKGDSEAPVSGGAVGDGTVLGLDLIAYDGYAFLEIQPQENYDRVELTMNGVLSALSKLKICGLYTRVDSDGDGIPDCADDNGEEEVWEVEDGAHTCEGNPLSVKVNKGGIKGNDYILVCNNQDTGQRKELTVPLTESGYFEIEGLNAGRYFISVYGLDGEGTLWNGASATVHPLLTEWTGATSTDWSEWSNWTEGSPWECTDVIIPSGVSRYPEIVSGDCCQNIHFEEGAAALNTHYLKYQQAFVDMRVKGGSYAYLSAPLQEMVTGDMFINPSVQWGKDNYFTVMDGINYKESRTNPMVFQRIYGGTRNGAYELPAVGDGLSVKITETGWSEDFNVVTMKYNAGEGFSLRAGKDGDRSSYRFRFPKAGYGSAGSGKDEYSYFNENGTVVRNERFYRDMDAVGRLFGGNVTVTLQADKGAYFLVGNPYMSYISTSVFMTRNRITELRLYDGNTNRTLLASGNGTLASEEGLPAVIAPMQSVLVKKTGTETSLTVNFTPEMQVQPSTVSRTKKGTDNGLYISVRKGGTTASCLLRISSSASNDYRASEDAEVLMDSESRPVVDVFTVAGGKALNIQQVKSATRIPLGIYLRTPGDVTLTVSGYSSGWILTDTQTGRIYTSSEMAKGVTVTGMKSGTGRLVLVKK